MSTINSESAFSNAQLEGAENNFPHLFWEEETHRVIVLRAIDLMRDYTKEGKNTYVKKFIEDYCDNIDFSECLFEGLKDADDKSPWKDKGWSRHFYNPHTKKNYLKDRNYTAHSEARRYFKLAEHYMQRITYFQSQNQVPDNQLYKNAGYYIGLSLHFLTDLTQPQHAANFTNIFGKENSIGVNADLRHSGFEVYTDNAVNKGLLDNLRPLKDLDLIGFKKNNVGTFVHDLALYSKDIFDNVMLAILDKKVLAYGPIKLYEGFWRDVEADEILKKTTMEAPYTVANYLTNLMFLASIPPTYSSNKWYEILEPTNAPNDHSNLDGFQTTHLYNGIKGKWLKGEKRNGKDSQKFYLIFNEDGTVSIGSKVEMNAIAEVAKGINDGSIGQTQGPIVRNSKFRIVSFEDGKVMLFESSKNEVLHVESSGWYRRYAPAYDDQQWFILREVGDITQDEAKKIQNYFPVFNKFNFAGEPHSVPDWERTIPDSIG